MSKIKDKVNIMKNEKILKKLDLELEKIKKNYNIIISSFENKKDYENLESIKNYKDSIDHITEIRNYLYEINESLKNK